MKIAFKNLRDRMSRLAVGVAAAALLAVGVVTAQSAFPQIFEGEMWEMVTVLEQPDVVGPVNGLAYTEVDGRLFVSDLGETDDGPNGTIVVFEPDLSVSDDFLSAAWRPGQSSVPESPVFGWQPNQLTTATVQVGTSPEQTAILVSDIAAGAHRVLAFSTSGTHLFTLGLDASLVATTQGCPGIPALECPVIAGFVNGVAMGPGAKFIFTPGVGVQLIGSFAAAWSEDLRRVGGTMAYHATTFAYDAGANPLSAGDDQYRSAAPTAILTADETVSGVPAAVRAQEPFGLTFDNNGNLYMSDSGTERLTVYGPGPSFTRRFTFGTPDPSDGGLTTIEFFQSYGIRFWPDENTSDPDEDDGRLFVADAINNRVVVYRPDFEASVPTLYSIFELDGIGALDGFPYGLALDTARGRIAIGDDDQQRVWILKTPDVAAFDVQVTDQALPEPSPVEVVCQGEPYTVRFSLTVPTVPSNRPSITGVTPLLTRSYFDQVGDPYPLWNNGDLVPGALPGGTYGTSLGPGEVMTFSYPLLAPADFEGEIVLVADVNFDNEAVDADILTREVTLLVSSCIGDPPVITATSSHEPQLTGWTPVPPGAPVVVTLAASDDPDATEPVGIRSIDYQILGANHTIPLNPVLNPSEDPSDFSFPVPLGLPGETTIKFRAWNNNLIRSLGDSAGWQFLPLRLVDVPNRTSDEGTAVTPFSVGPAGPVAGVTYSASYSASGSPSVLGLPSGLSIDASTGEISGGFGYDSAGDYTVTVTESRAGDPSTSVMFLWRVNPVNRAPQVTNDTYSIDEDTQLVVAAPGVLSNDSDLDGDALVANLEVSPSSGDLDLEPDGDLNLQQDGSFTYTPEDNFNGEVTFRYKAHDGTSDTEAIVTILVNSVNDAPVAVTDTLAAVEDIAVDYDAADLLVNDTDADDDTLTIESVTSLTGGTVVLNGQTVTFTPAADSNGPATFTYTVTDTLATHSVEVTVNVAPANDPPSFTKGSDSTVSEDSGPQTLPGWAGAINAGPADETGQTLTFLISTTNSALFAAEPTLAADGTLRYEPAANAFGSATVTVSLQDNGGGDDTSAEQQFTIFVTGVNDGPVATDGTASVDEDGTLPGTLVATDIDSTVLTYAVVTGPAHGTVVLGANGSYTYEPEDDYNGPDSFTFTATDDGDLDSNVATVTITVNPLADAPVASDSNVSVDEDGTLPATLPATDIDSPVLTYAVVTGPTHGTVVIGANGSYTYEPEGDYNGPDSFTFMATDAGDLDSNVATVTITVNAVNDAPVATGGTASVDEDGTLPGTLVATDLDSTVLTYAVVTGPANGTVVLGANGSYTYEPEPDYNGGDSFTFQANDGDMDSNVATVTITVNPSADAPVASDGNVSVDEDGTLTATLPAAVNPDGSETPTYALATGAAQGAVTVAPDGSYEYTPSPNYYGPDSFTYTANVGTLTSSAATITITVNAVNDAPSFTAATVPGVNEDSGSQSVAWASDMDAGPQESQTLTFVVTNNDNPALFATLPAVSSTGTLTYTPAPNASGNAIVRVVLNDGGGGDETSDPVIFTIAVTAANDAPSFTKGADSTVLEDSGAQTVAGWASAISAGPVDEALQTLTFLVSNTNNALFAVQPTLAADGTLSYAPAANAFGSATVTVSLQDNGGTANGGVDTSAQQFTITVTGVNDEPSFTAGTVPSVNEDSGPHSVAWATAITAGPMESAQTLSFVVTNNNNALFATQPAVSSTTGALTYTLAPNASGSATVTVLLQDNGGTANGGDDTSASVTFTIAVIAANDAPVAANNTYTTVEGSVLNVPAPGVLGNDTDVDSTTLTARLISGPSQGALTLNTDGSFSFTPPIGFTSTATFTYVANDGTADSAEATVSIAVTGSNLPPVCSATVSPALLWPPNHKKVYLTLSGITDPEGGPLTILFTILQDEPTTGPGQGNTMQDGGIEAHGTKVWVRAERSGTGDGRIYLISYTATDAAGASCTGQVTVGVPHDQSGAPPVLSPGRWNSLTGELVTPPPAPVAVNDSATVAKGDDKDIAVLANDIAHGMPLTVTIVTHPVKGTVRVNSNGTINYDAPSNWAGTTSFTYKVSNGFSISAPATVTVVVTNGSSHDDDDCGDRNHDHRRDRDGRDRDHKRGDHDRCKHGDRDDADHGDNDRDDNDRDDDDRDGNDRDDDDCGDPNHDHGRDNDNRDRDHRRGDHDRCNHRR